MAWGQSRQPWPACGVLGRCQRRWCGQGGREKKGLPGSRAERKGSGGAALLRELVRRVRGEPRVGHPRDLRVLLEVLRERDRVAVVPLHAQAERLEPLQEEEGAERVEGGAQVAEALDARADHEGDVHPAPSGSGALRRR